MKKQLADLLLLSSVMSMPTSFHHNKKTEISLPRKIYKRRKKALAAQQGKSRKINR